MTEALPIPVLEPGTYVFAGERFWCVDRLTVTRVYLREEPMPSLVTARRNWTPNVMGVNENWIERSEITGKRKRLVVVAAKDRDQLLSVVGQCRTRLQHHGMRITRLTAELEAAIADEVEAVAASLATPPSTGK